MVKVRAVTLNGDGMQNGGSYDQVVHVDSRYASQVTFDSRIRDRSRVADSAGTRVPVVPEDEFASTPVALLNVPLEALLRLTLRIYALPQSGPAVTPGLRVGVCLGYEQRDAAGDAHYALNRVIRSGARPRSRANRIVPPFI